MSHQTAKETIPKERDDRHVWIYFVYSLNIFQSFGGPADLENILSFQNEGELHWTLAWAFCRPSFFPTVLQHQEFVPVTNQYWAWAAFVESNGSSVAL